MTIATTIPTISSATSNIRMRNTASPVLPVLATRGTKYFFVLLVALFKCCSICSDRIDLGFGFLHDVSRQRRVLQFLREVLAVVQSPPQKVDERFSFRGVFLIFVNKNVCVTRNR